MKKGGYKLIFLILFAAALLCAGATAVYAFFAAYDSTDAISVSQSYDVYNNDGIQSEYQLRVISDERYYNSLSGVSDMEDRRNVRITQKITLTKDLIITADINLNLGGEGCGIDLNGHTLTFKNYCYGSIVISNGSITNSSQTAGYVVIDTPNAIVLADETTGFTVGTNVNYTVAAFSKDALINEIFSYTDNYFANFYNKDISGTINYYVYDDMELISYYRSLKVLLTWASTDETAVTPGGKVTRQATDTVADVTLTLSGGELLLLQGGEITRPLSKTYRITVVSDSFDRIEIGTAELNGFFEYYKYGSDSYYIYNDINLPSVNDYYGLSYSYTATNNVDAGISDIVLNGGIYTLKRDFTQRTITLTARITNNITSDYTDVVYSVNAVVKNNYEIANGIVDSMGLLIVETAETVIALPDISSLTAQGVKSVTYTLENNNNNYQISENTVTVITLPSITDAIYLKINFEFITGTPITVERQVRIFYVDATLGGGGDSSDVYAYYYAYLTDLLLEKTAGKTFESFTMPNEHLNHTIEYNITSGDSGISRVVDGSNISLGYYVSETYYKIIEVVPDASSVQFNIYFDNLRPEDHNVIISYLFDYTSGEKIYYKKTNSFIISGIIHNTEQGIPDSTLYNAVLSHFDANSDGVLTSDEAKADAASFSVNSAVTSFKGINYLENTAAFNFDGTGFNGAAMQYLGELDNITSLSLKNNGITDSDLTGFAGMRNLLTLDLSCNSITSLDNLPLYTAVTTFRVNNNAVSDISGINKFIKLHDLYIDGNGISDFRALLDVSTLQGGSVNIYYDDTEANVSASDIGKYNLTVFVLMYKKGISIYRTFTDISDKAFAPSAAEIKGTEVLESIVYSNYSNTQIILPYKIYKSPGDESPYEITWYLSSLSSYSTAWDNPVTGEVTVTHSSAAGTYKVYGSVTVTVLGNSATVYRPFYIEVAA